MSVLQQAIQLKCNKVVIDKTNINHKKQTGSSCIMLLPLKQLKIAHCNITFGCDFFSLNQYYTGYLNAFEPQKKK